MARVTAEEFANKHARRLKASTEDIVAGIDKVSKAPGISASEKVAKMRARLVAKIDDGTWERRVKAVSLEEWKNKAKTKGVPRIATGIDEAHDKQVAFANQLLPAVDSAKALVSKMPDLTLEDSIARSRKMITEMAKFHKK